MSYSLAEPFIAAINGPAAGLGFAIPLFADMRFASDRAVFTTAFSQRESIDLMRQSFDRPDFKEGVQSFLEKRLPKLARIKFGLQSEISRPGCVRTGGERHHGSARRTPVLLFPRP